VTCYAPASGFGAACPGWFLAHDAGGGAWNFGGIPWTSQHNTGGFFGGGHGRQRLLGFAVGVSSAQFTFDTLAPVVVSTLPAGAAFSHRRRRRISGTAADTPPGQLQPSKSGEIGTRLSIYATRERIGFRRRRDGRHRMVAAPASSVAWSTAAAVPLLEGAT